MDHILFILAFGCMVADAIGVQSRVKLFSLSLAFVIATFIV